MSSGPAVETLWCLGRQRRIIFYCRLSPTPARVRTGELSLRGCLVVLLRRRASGGANVMPSYAGMRSPLLLPYSRPPWRSLHRWTRPPRGRTVHLSLNLGARSPRRSGGGAARGSSTWSKRGARAARPPRDSCCCCDVGGSTVPETVRSCEIYHGPSPSFRVTLFRVVYLRTSWLRG